MARIEIDPKMQPPTSQKKYNDSSEVVEKGVMKDKLKVDTLNEEKSGSAPSLGAMGTSGEHGEVRDFVEGTDPKSADAADEDEEIPEVDIKNEEWLARARNAYDASTSFFDNNIRPDLDNSIRAFHNQHKTSSPLSSTSNTFTSKVYRPKTRSALMKYEAAADTAYFSNPDIISIEAENPGDKNEVVSAACIKALAQYRLTKTIPWYQIVIGGFQDAQVQGLAVAKYHWKSKVGTKSTVDDEGNVAQSKFFEIDKPMIELIPLENFRFDPNASWVDIVNSSPYIIHLHPMFVGDIKTMMDEGHFEKLSDEQILSANAEDTRSGESTRTNRSQSGSDPRATATREISDYEVVVVQEHCHRIDGDDFVWFTLNNSVMLKKPVPIEELYFTGDRQYVVGQTVIETHNPYSSSIPTIVSGVQEEINEIANQRLNNVKLVMNKKFIIKSDSEIDLGALLRNQAGSAVYTQDPAADVREISTPDVTQSSYLEQDRLNSDFDELVSNFQASSLMGQPAGGADTWRGMQMLNSNANIVLEHQLRIFTQTFVEPLLRGLIKLEAKYETDETVFALIGKQQSEVLMRYGMNEVTDEMFDHELVVKVNVGMNNTDPMTKTARLTGVLMTLNNIISSPASKGLDMKEVTKELFANAGFGDGMRFINQQQDPATAALQQEIQMLRKKVADKEAHEMTSLLKGRESNQTKLSIAAMKNHTDNAKFLAEKAFTVASMPVQSNQPQGPQATPNPLTGQ